jgi:hypothetical protein
MKWPNGLAHEALSKLKVYLQFCVAATPKDQPHILDKSTLTSAKILLQYSCPKKGPVFLDTGQSHG